MTKLVEQKWRSLQKHFPGHMIIEVAGFTHNYLLKIQYGKSQILRHLYVFCDLNFTKHINFQSLEVVDCSSETQLQVPEN